MFGDGMIKVHYGKFKEQADLILEADRKQEEDEFEKMEEELKHKHSNPKISKLLNSRKKSILIAAEIAA